MDPAPLFPIPLCPEPPGSDDFGRKRGVLVIYATTDVGQDRLRTPPPPRTVIFHAVPDLQILDLVGPMEVFHGADRIARSEHRAGYDLTVVSATPGRLTTSGGLGIHAEPLPDPDIPIDTLVLPGGDGARATPADSPAIEWIRRAAPQARRVATVCTGCFLAGPACWTVNGSRPTGSGPDWCRPSSRPRGSTRTGCTSRTVSCGRRAE